MSVWFDSSLGREVAIKALSASGIGGSLRTEAALLAAINSKHVVELLDICNDTKTGEEYLVMEYIPGAELSNFAPSSTTELYINLYQIATGLQDIHKADCIHRDIKPENIKHDSNSIIKIIDLGIGSPTSTFVTNRGRGTNGYCGNEYFITPIQLTKETDIFAFGSTAFKFSFGALDPLLLQCPPAKPPSFSTARIGPNQEKLANEISHYLDQCFDPSPANRPSAEALSMVFSKHLSHGKHVGHFVHRGNSYFIHNTAPSFKISTSSGSFFIVYDSIDFIIRTPTGEVYINRMPAHDGMKLPKSCVITLGSGSGPGRTFIPFNASHPEVIL